MADLEVLGPAEPPRDLLGDVVRAALRDDAAEVLGAHGRRDRLPVHEHRHRRAVPGHRAPRRPTGGERPWSAFVKVLQHPRHWPLIDHVPPAGGRGDPASCSRGGRSSTPASRCCPCCPPGLRVPDVYAVADLGDDRLAWWMEDIDVDDDPWTDETYARAAHLLARLAARRTPGTAAGASDLPARLRGPQGRGHSRSAARRLLWPMTPCGLGRWSPAPSTRAYRADLAPGAGR